MDKSSDRLPKGSLLNRVTGYFILFCLVIVALTVGLDYLYFSNSYRKQAQTELDEVGLAVVRRVTPALAARDLSVLEKLGDSFIETGGIDGLRIRGADGVVWYDRPGPSEGAVTRSFPVSGRGGLLGTVEVWSDYRPMLSALRRYVAMEAGAFLAVVMVIAVVLYFLPRSRLRAMQRQMEDGAARLMQKDGEVSEIRVRYREFGFLARIFRELGINIRSGLEEVDRAERAQRKLVESMSEGLAVLDLEDRFTFVNRRMAAMLGAAGKDELVGACARDFLSAEGAITFGRHGPERRSGAGVRFELSWQDKDGKQIPTVVSLVPVLGEGGEDRGCLMVVTDISEQKQARQKLLEHRDRLRHMASALALAEARERRRIATEIHDHLSQGLALTQIKLEEVKSGVSEPRWRIALGTVIDQVEQLNKDARSLMFELSPPILYEFGLPAALEWLADKVHEERGIQVYYACEPEDLALSEDVAVMAFQMVRELIMNVIKHARAKNVMIRVQEGGDQVRIYIEDDGVGKEGLSTETLEQHSGKSLGLLSIQERVRDIGGGFEIESFAGKGTRAILSLPPAESNKSQRKEPNHETKGAVGRRP